MNFSMPRYNAHVLVFLIYCLSFIPFFYIPTVYQDVFLVPHNIFIWLVPSFCFFYSTWVIYKRKSLVVPKYFNLIFCFIIFISLGFLVSILSSSIFDGWWFRLVFVLSGPLFLLSLLQIEVKRRVLYNSLYILLFGLFIHALVAFIQTLPGRPLYALIPRSADQEPLGIFMQRNNLASAMVTAVVLGLYLTSAPDFRYRRTMLKGLVLAAVFACSAIVMMTGSRVGLLGFIIAVPIMLAARYRLLKTKPLLLGCVLFALLSGSVFGISAGDGFWIASSKIERLAEENGEARKHIYKISWDIFMEKPLAGHGVGSFQSVFHNRAAEYMALKGGQPLIGHARFTHPHNEILLWAIETGILSVIGIGMVVAAGVRQLYRIGWQRGGAMAALIIPIALHTQVELPFYYSHYHWLLFVFILYLLFKPFSKNKAIKKTGSSLLVVPLAGFLVLFLAVLFCTSTFSTSRDVVKFLYYHDVDLNELEEAQESLYFGRLADVLVSQVKLNSDFKNGTDEFVFEYIEWATEDLKTHPDAKTYHNVALAYYYVGNDRMMEKTIDEGLYFFPEHPIILSVYDKRELFDPL